MRNILLFNKKRLKLNKEDNKNFWWRSKDSSKNTKIVSIGNSKKNQLEEDKNRNLDNNKKWNKDNKRNRNVSIRASNRFRFKKVDNPDIKTDQDPDKDITEAIQVLENKDKNRDPLPIPVLIQFKASTIQEVGRKSKSLLILIMIPLIR